MSVYVTFTGITYKNKELIWKYEESNNRAYLIFDDESKSGKNGLINYLGSENYSEHMVFNKGSIEIRNVKMFSRQFAMHHVNTQKQESKEPDEGSHQPVFSRKNSLSPLFIRKVRRTKSEFDIRSTVKVSPPTLTRTTHSEKGTPVRKEEPPVNRHSARFDTAKDEDRKGFLSILIPDLIDKNLDEPMWRETLAVKDKFQELSTAKEESISKYLRPKIAFTLSAQFSKNRILYAAKTELLDSIEELFAEILNPLYLKWCKTHDLNFRSALYYYLQNAVHRVMLNAKFNKEPTEYEHLSEDDINDKFEGNQNLQFFAINKNRELRAKLMLTKLSFLIKLNQNLNTVIDICTVDSRKVLKLYKDLLPFYSKLNPAIESRAPRRVRLSQIKAFIDKVNSLLEVDAELSLQLEEINAQDDLATHQFRDLFSRTIGQSLSEAEQYINSRILITAVTSFRQNLLAKPSNSIRLEEKLKVIRAHILEVSAIEQRYKEETDQLFIMLNKIDAPEIDNFISFKELISTHLTSKFREKYKTADLFREDIVLITKRACDEVISFISVITDKAVTDIMPRPPMLQDGTFYLNQEWADGVTQAIEAVELSNLLKHPGRKKLIDAYVLAVKNAVKDYIQDTAAQIAESLLDSSLESISDLYAEPEGQTLKISTL